MENGESILSVISSNYPRSPLNVPNSSVFHNLPGPAPAHPDHEPISSQKTSDTCKQFWCHWPTVLRLFYYAGIVAGTVLIILGATGYFTEKFPLWFGVGTHCISYLVYLVDTFYLNHNLKHLRNIETVAGVQSHISIVKQSEPHITWHMTCYHRVQGIIEMDDGVDGKGRDVTIQMEQPIHSLNTSKPPLDGPDGLVPYDPLNQSQEQLVQGPLTSQKTSTACTEFWCDGANIFRLFYHAGIIAGIVLISLGAVGPYNSRTLLWIGVGILPACYLIYLVDTFCFNTNLKYLNNVGLINGIQNHIAEVKQAVPLIIWHMTCYHYETRHRRVSYQSNGKTHYRTESYQERCNTWSGSQAFIFSSCWDASPPNMSGLGEYKQTRIKFYKTFAFEDPNTEACFIAERDGFVAANRCRDVHYDFSEEFTVPGFQTAVVASTTTERPFYLKKRYYFLAVLFLMELPYSFCLKKGCPVSRFTYKKIIRR